MAFRAAKRKEVRKQSYYVWFLGAKESKGLRGEEYIRPVLRHLLERERELEPTKVTLQVSGKGLKIVQNVPRKNNRSKTEQIKHSIPHHAVTCALQESRPDEDIVCCILLVYNPLTRCPVHVHAYRCDSVETAGALRAQLQALIDRSDNQKKFREIESRLAAKGLLPPRRLDSDGRSTRTGGSERTEDSFGSDREDEEEEEEEAVTCAPRDPRVARLYDSLAAELRERLGDPNRCPLLLPPRDYDTVSRRRGRLQGIEQRRSTNLCLVGRTPCAPALPTRPEPDGRLDGSSGKFSIGSDEARNSALRKAPPFFRDKTARIRTTSEGDRAFPEDGDRSLPWGRPASPSGQAEGQQAHRALGPSSSCPAVPSPPTYLFGQREHMLRLEMARQGVPANDGPGGNGPTASGDGGGEREVVRRMRSSTDETPVPKTDRPFSYPNRQTPQRRPSSASLRPHCGRTRPEDPSGSLSPRDCGVPGCQQGEEEEQSRRRSTSPRADRGRPECHPPPDRSSHQPDDRRKSGYRFKNSCAEPWPLRLPLGARQ